MIRQTENPPAVILNVGTGKFFLHQTAESLSELGQLKVVISGITKLPRIVQIEALSEMPRISRLKNRIHPLSSEVCEVQVFSGEILWQIGTIIAKSRYFNSVSKYFYFTAGKSFDFAARRYLKKSDPFNCVYHFRAGFGGGSIQVARNLGIPTICDHSISHPHYDWRTGKVSSGQTKGYFNLERLIFSDINSADHVIVNSEFVAKTFLRCGDTRKLNVMTPPIDRKFVDIARAPITDERVGIVFVGKCELRKGIDTFTDIVKRLPTSIPIYLAGSWTPEAAIFKRELEKLSNVQMLPYMGYIDIARLMRHSVIFLFPSRAEGSARVIGEAMHAGCIPFITRESGVNFDSNTGFFLNGMTSNEIGKTIERILSDRNEQMKYSASARDSIELIEQSYLPDLLSLYKIASMNERR